MPIDGVELEKVLKEIKDHEAKGECKGCLGHMQGYKPCDYGKELDRRYWAALKGETKK